MKLFYFVSIINISCILFFKQIEQIVFNFGCTWTFSKIFPYALLVFFGILLAFITTKSTLIHKISKKWLKIFVIVIAFTLPFTLGFALHPIYEGDFSLNGEEITKNLSPLDFEKDGITVIAIPGCHFCFESIEKLKKIKKRNPKLSINFVVCCDEKKLLTDYIKEVNGAFTICNSKNPMALAKMSNHIFPSFIKVKNKKPIYSWSNDQFGVRAIDFIEHN